MPKKMTTMRILRIAFLVIGGLLGGIGRALFLALTGRDLAAEAADEAQEQARQVAAEETQAQADADRAATLEARAEALARHEETTLLAEQQLAESRALREELARVARRREEIAAQSRAHNLEVRSSTWDVDEEPESGAPTPSYA